MWTVGRRPLLALAIVSSLIFIYNFVGPTDLHASDFIPSRSSAQKGKGDMIQNEVPGKMIQPHHEDITSTSKTSSLFDLSSRPVSYETLPKPDHLHTTLLDPNAPEGFTTFSRLYLHSGVLYAIVHNHADKKNFPDLKFVLAQPKRMSEMETEPTAQEMQIITESEADEILGPDALQTAVVIDGLSVILYDVYEFMNHYYHWWGELILGMIRAYSALSFIPGIETPLIEPSRFLLPHVYGGEWRDPAGVDGPLMRAAFPNAPIEQGDCWDDLVNLNRTYVFERALIVSRIAAHRSPLASLWFKMISSTMNITVPAQFWEPLRRRVVRNTVRNEANPRSSSAQSTKPLVTYISRQGNRRPEDLGRRLIHEDHLALISAMQELEQEGICDFMMVMMENMSLEEQIGVVAKSTVMIGVHGNGLTHQVWMPYSPQSTVIEIFFPKSYLHDYEILSRNMGHKHYAFWNDTILTYPEGEWFKGVEGGKVEDFNGNSIPIHGPTVARVVRERLMVSPLTPVTPDLY